MLIRPSRLRLTHPSPQDRRTVSTRAMWLLSCQRKHEITHRRAAGKKETPPRGRAITEIRRKKEAKAASHQEQAHSSACGSHCWWRLHRWYPGRIREAARSRACGSVTQSAEACGVCDERQVKQAWRDRSSAQPVCGVFLRVPRNQLREGEWLMSSCKRKAQVLGRKASREEDEMGASRRARKTNYGAIGVKCWKVNKRTMNDESPPLSLQRCGNSCSVISLTNLKTWYNRTPVTTVIFFAQRICRAIFKANCPTWSLSSTDLFLGRGRRRSECSGLRSLCF